MASSLSYLLKLNRLASSYSVNIVFALILPWVVVAAPKDEAPDGALHIHAEAGGVADIGKHRDDRFIAFLKIYPEECTTEDNLSGTCLTSTACSLKGEASGTCAKGFGTCCKIQQTCGGTSSYDNTYFVNPNYPSTDSATGMCMITINRASTNICQMRLDFVDMELAQPDGEGDCTTDFLTVSGGTSTTPTICGSNTGQHMYVDVDPDSTGPLKVTVDRSQSTTARNWNIKVEQIPCTSTEIAPSGCLQYYTETSGTIQSYNFQNTISEGTPQIANQNYGACIKMATGYCGVIWERDTSVGNNGFTVSSNTDAVSPNIIGTPDAGMVGPTCDTDYVIIPGGVSDLGAIGDRYCGLGFPTSVTTTSKPFVLYVVTDDNEDGDKPTGDLGTNSGFSLNYRQTTNCG